MKNIEEKYVSNFIKNVFDDNFALAKSDLETALVEKLKGRMKNEMIEQVQADQKIVKNTKK